MLVLVRLRCLGGRRVGARVRVDGARARARCWFVWWVAVRRGHGSGGGSAHVLVDVCVDAMKGRVEDPM